jgi:hypothetical protein
MREVVEADEFQKASGKKLMKAGLRRRALATRALQIPTNVRALYADGRPHDTRIAGSLPRLQHLKVLRLSNNKRKSGPLGFLTGSRPAPYKSL